MKKLIFIDNEKGETTRANYDTARRRLNLIGKLPLNIVKTIQFSDGFYFLSDGDKEDLLFADNTVIFTYSMFTENHLGSYYQLAEYLQWAGVTQMKERIYIDTSSYLKQTLERICDSTTLGQVGQIIRAIELNHIIGYDSDDSKFYRFFFNPKEDKLIGKQETDLASILV